MSALSRCALLAIRAAAVEAIVLVLNPGCLSDFKQRPFRLDPDDCVSLQSCGGPEASAPPTGA
jgi:hypothetical protein